MLRHIKLANAASVDNTPPDGALSNIMKSFAKMVQLCEVRPWSFVGELTRKVCGTVNFSVFKFITKSTTTIIAMAIVTAKSLMIERTWKSEQGVVSGATVNKSNMFVSCFAANLKKQHIVSQRRSKQAMRRAFFSNHAWVDRITKL